MNDRLLAEFERFGARLAESPYEGLGADAAADLSSWFAAAEGSAERGLRSPERGGAASGAEGAHTLAPSHIGLTGNGSAPEIAAPAPSLGADRWHVRKKSVDGYMECVAVRDVEGTLSRGRGRRKVPRKRAEVDEWERAARRLRAARRSKAALRWQVRCLRADTMFTLTKRHRIPTWGEAWRLWGLFEQMCSRRFRKFEYVVTIEPHQIDGWHIHFVVRGYHHLDTMRLFWHRVLLAEPRLRAIRRGVESPGNIKMSDCGGGYRKLAEYLAKYLGKTFEELRDEGRVKRFASSKGIEAPKVERSWMPSCAGGEAYELRRRLEGEGWRVTATFESTVCGEPMIWMQAMRRGPPR